MDAWMPGCSDVCQRRYLALPCRREHQFEGQAGGGRLTLGLHLGTLGLHLGTLGVHFRIFFPLWGEALESLGHLLEKASKKVPKMRGMGTQSADIFDDILSCRGK